MKRKSEASETMFGEFLERLKAQADEQDKAKSEQFRQLFNAATAHSPAVFHRFDSATGRYLERGEEQR